MTKEIKDALFTAKDILAGAELSPLSIENALFAKGIKSKTLLQNQVFQEACAQLYLALITAEDEIEIGSNLDKVEDLRIQRRLLRQLIASLDNQVHNMEVLEDQKRAEREFNNEGELREN